MNYKQSYLLVAIVLCFVTKSFSQHQNYHITNGIAVFGGITKFGIATDNFATKKGSGFSGGMSATVDIPHRWYNVSFGMNLSESTLGISARPDVVSTEDTFIDYKMFAAQIALLGHIKVGTPHFTIDVGPMLQYNSDLELKDKNQEGYYVNHYTNLLASDVKSITPFNINGVVGASVGYEFIKLRAQYIYGATNTLKKLNSKDLDTSGGKSTFKGHQNMLIFGAMISF